MFGKILMALLCLSSYPTITWTAAINSTVNNPLKMNLQTLSLNKDSERDSQYDEDKDPYSNFLFYEATQTYYPYTPGSPIQGPCGKLMSLFKESTDNNNGICRCEQAQPLCPGRPLLYWNETNQCHYAYQQGPCGEGEWLTNNDNEESVCQNNPCSSRDNQVGSSSYSAFYFSYHDTCYKTNTTAFCQGTERVFILRTHPGPICMPNEPTCVHGYKVAFSAALKCPPRTRLEADGGCAKIVSLD